MVQSSIKNKTNNLVHRLVRLTYRWEVYNALHVTNTANLSLYENTEERGGYLLAQHSTCVWSRVDVNIV